MLTTKLVRLCFPGPEPADFPRSLPAEAHLRFRQIQTITDSGQMRLTPPLSECGEIGESLTLRIHPSKPPLAASSLLQEPSALPEPLRALASIAALPWLLRSLHLIEAHSLWPDQAGSQSRTGAAVNFGAEIMARGSAKCLSRLSIAELATRTSRWKSAEIRVVPAIVLGI